jgi:hypothetical protein
VSVKGWGRDNDDETFRVEHMLFEKYPNLMSASERRLISMISTKGKSPEQVEAEAHQALQKYFDANPQSRPPNYPASGEMAGR